jgi:four helix bundle protein
MQAAPEGGMHDHPHQDVIQHAVEVITAARPLIETVARRDRDLGSQLRRALSSVALNLAEGLGTSAGNARLRFETARGSLCEARAAFRVAVAWAYVSQDGAQGVLQSIDRLGARVFGLARR